MMANHQYQVSAINADDFSRATLEARRENHASINALRKKGGPWKEVEIPLRSLMAKDVDGLVLAGRCISGGFIAHSSYRVTGNAVAMGEAAGVACAAAAREKVLPHEVPFAALGAKA